MLWIKQCCIHGSDWYIYTLYIGLVLEDTPMGIVVRHLQFMDIPPMMLPLKKMKYMDVDVFVPNNPIIFLEKIFEQGNDVRFCEKK